jgi:hypothetical protein
VPTRRKRVFLDGVGIEGEEDKEGKEDKDAILGIAADKPASFSSASKFKKVESIYNPVAPSL